MRIRRQGPSLVVDTPAKLNLFLEVHGRRPDGYHEIETVMVSVGLFDTLRFTPEREPMLKLSVLAATASAADVPINSDNLVLRAASLLREHAGRPAGASIELVKRIPSQAGMGGGSSDAAAALVGLNQLWNLGLPPTELHQLAAALGSDVNFFLDSVPLAVCRGRGEAIDSRPLRERLSFVVAQPQQGLSTAEVFRAWQDEGARRSSDRLLAAADGLQAWPELYNALQAPAERSCPVIATILRRMRQIAKGPALMTGSGSACFALCRTDREAARAAALLRRDGLRAWRMPSSA